MDLLMRQYNGLQAQLQQATETIKIEAHERQALKNVHEQQKKMINTWAQVFILIMSTYSDTVLFCRLMIQVRQQEINHAQLLEASKLAKSQLEELVPEANSRRETESEFSCDFL